MLRHATLQIIIFLTVFVAIAPGSASADVGAQGYIQDVAQKAFATVAAVNISDKDRNNRFRQAFLSAFDIPEMGKTVLSRHWVKASPAQQKAFLKEFEDTQVLTWGRRFRDYNGLRLETLGEVKEGDAGWLVDSRIIQTRGPPISMQWRLRPNAEGNTRITDIIVEGISMVLTCRDDYGSALQRSGGNVDALLSAMRTKNEQLTGPP